MSKITYINVKDLTFLPYKIHLGLGASIRNIGTKNKRKKTRGMQVVAPSSNEEGYSTARRPSTNANTIAIIADMVSA